MLGASQAWIALGKPLGAPPRGFPQIAAKFAKTSEVRTIAAQTFPKRIAELARNTWYHTRRAQLPMVAGSLSYVTIISIIPLLAVSFAIFQIFGGFEKVRDVVEPFILNNLAEGVSDQVIDMLHRAIQSAHTKTIGITGVVGVIFTSMAMLWNIEKAINRVWNAPLRRSWFRRLSSYWLFITIGPLGLAVALGIESSKDLPVTRLLPSGAGIFAILVAVFYLVYKWVPHTHVHDRYAAISAVFASFLFTLARTGYHYYMSKAVSYSHIYGSLAAVPILLVWIYIVWLVILSGAALTASLQKISDDDERAAMQNP